MAAQTVTFVEPAEGRKHLSKHRNVQLPLQNFEDREHNEEIIPFTPINQALKTTQNRSTDTLEPARIVKFRVYLTRIDNNAVIENGVELSIESGRTANTNTLLFYLAREYEIDFHAFTETFALWMISPLLEVQLKAYHRPYDCRQGWQTLLDRFAAQDTSIQTRNSDEPVLMLRRNVSMTSEREFELLDRFPQSAQFLIIDAREALLFDRLHFLAIEDIVQIAALIFCIQYGNFQEGVHDVAFIRHHIEEVFSERVAELIVSRTFLGKSLNKKTVNEDRLLKSWKEVSNIGSLPEKEHKLLMALTQNSSCYGSAWFNGRIEKKTSRANIKNFGQSFAEIKIRLGINDRFLTIVDAESSETLLVQSIEDLSWQLEPAKENQEAFLILTLACDDHPNNGNEVTETTFFLMVTGNQMALADALLRTLTGRRLERTISDSSSSESSSSSYKHASLIQSKLETKDCAVMNNRKLCLAKFQNGKCTEVAGTFKSYYCHGQSL